MLSSEINFLPWITFWGLFETDFVKFDSWGWFDKNFVRFKVRELVENSWSTN
jgi:hypothetical protein